MQDALQRIAQLAPTLSHAELRALLELTRRAREIAENQISISSRKLAKAANLSHSRVKVALADLNRGGVITSTTHKPTEPATHRLNYLVKD